MFRDTGSMNKHLQKHGPRKISIGKYFYLLRFCLYIYKVYMFVINVKNHLLKVQNYVVINLYTLVKKHFNVHLKDVEKVFHLILIYGHMFEFIQMTNHTFVHLMVVVVDLPNQQISNNILHMQKFVHINHLLFQPLLLLLQKKQNKSDDQDQSTEMSINMSFELVYVSSNIKQIDFKSQNSAMNTVQISFLIVK